jgi:hypothetical protein
MNKMNKSSVFLLSLAGTLIFSLLGATSAAAQSKAAKPKQNVVKSAAQKSKAGTEDANVKKTSDLNDPKKVVNAPSKKGGQTRGEGPWDCYIHVDNQTPWIAKVYIDGGYVGTIGAYGDLLVLTGNGASAAYARADFPDGSRLHWGPTSFTCVAGVENIWPMLP